MVNIWTRTLAIKKALRSFESYYYPVYYYSANFYTTATILYSILINVNNLPKMCTFKLFKTSFDTSKYFDTGTHYLRLAAEIEMLKTTDRTYN